MKIEEILSHVDHTLLKQTSTGAQIKALMEEGLAYQTASVCIPPSFVKFASNYLNGRLPVCTVIGFPNGYSTTACKVFEAKEAVSNGADEIDMVINLGYVKEKAYDSILREINSIKEAVGSKILKVIIEACFLTQDEKIKLCEIVRSSYADFIKTSTGFGSCGATPADISLFSSHIGSRVKIKAAGGIRSLADAEHFLRLGAERLGSSSIVAFAKEQTPSAY